MEEKNVQTIQEDIIQAALPAVSFDGWNWDVIETAANDAGYDAQTANAVFPEKLMGASQNLSAMADRWMLENLEGTNPDDLRIRDRVRTAVLVRLETLEPHKDAIRLISGYWAMPMRQIQAGKTVWRTADVIWNWAGDTATDYNHYTKRGLLSSILAGTTLVWLDDAEEGHPATHGFLDRRIDDVMQIGKFMRRFKK